MHTLKLSLLLLTYVTITSCSFISTYSDSKHMYLCPIKNENFSLSQAFLTQIKTLFSSHVFIETGTYLGNTSSLASNIFNRVYTVELSNNLYKQALKRFENEKKDNVHVYNDNSPDFLKKIIPNIIDPVVIFLDAHWSEGATAKGDCNTPIIDELDIIKNKRKSDCILLIDDIRLFKKNNDSSSCISGYPTLDILIKKGSEIFENLGFVIFGDIAIMYDASLHKLTISQVLTAITNYKLAMLENNLNTETIFDLQQKLSSTSGIELDGINWLTKLAEIPPLNLSIDFLVWKYFTILKPHDKCIAKKTFTMLDKSILPNAYNQLFKYIETNEN